MLSTPSLLNTSGCPSIGSTVRTDLRINRFLTKSIKTFDTKCEDNQQFRLKSHFHCIPINDFNINTNFCFSDVKHIPMSGQLSHKDIPFTFISICCNLNPKISFRSVFHIFYDIFIDFYVIFCANILTNTD